MSNLHCATTLEPNLCGKDFSPTTATESNSQWMQLPHRWTRLSDLSTQFTLKITETLCSTHDQGIKYKVQCRQFTVVLSRYFWCSDVQNTDDTMWKYKVQIQCKQFTVVLSRYYCACVNENTGVGTKIRSYKIHPWQVWQSQSSHSDLYLEK